MVLEGVDGTESFFCVTLGQHMLMLILYGPFKQLKAPALLNSYNIRVPKDM